MEKLFNNIIDGLQQQGFMLIGGGTLFAILTKDENVVKVFKAYDSNYFIVRYSVKEKINEF